MIKYKLEINTDSGKDTGTIVELKEDTVAARLAFIEENIDPSSTLLILPESDMNYETYVVLDKIESMVWRKQ